MVHLASAPALFPDPTGEMCLWVWIEGTRHRIPVDTITLCNLAEDATKEIRKRVIDKRLMEPG